MQKLHSHSLDEQLNPAINSSSTSSESKIENVEVAIKHMLTWTEHILQSFQDLRWKLIGYDSGPSQQPLYQMSNPNTVLDKLQDEYVQNVYDSLTFIVQTNTDANKASTNGNKGNSNKGSKSASKRSTNTQNNTTTSSVTTSNHKKGTQAEVTPVPSSSSTSHPWNKATNVEDVIAPAAYPIYSANNAPSYFQNNNIPQPSSSSNYPTNTTNVVESVVYYIVAIPYDIFNNMKATGRGNVAELYFPAYDHNQELVSIDVVTRPEQTICLTISFIGL